MIGENGLAAVILSLGEGRLNPRGVVRRAQPKRFFKKQVWRKSSWAKPVTVHSKNWGRRRKNPSQRISTREHHPGRQPDRTTLEDDISTFTLERSASGSAAKCSPRRRGLPLVCVYFRSAPMLAMFANKIKASCRRKRLRCWSEAVG